MKKILFASAIAALCIAVIVMAYKLRRLNPPADYEYSFRVDVDADYHDQKAIKDYYATGYAVGSFAREMWQERGLDVRFPTSDDAASQAATLHYNSLKAYTDSLGNRLSRSKNLKAQGLTNVEIKYMETADISLNDALAMHTYGAPMLTKGDRTAGVLLLQRQLLSLAYAIPTDGYYMLETEAAVKAFQVKEQLFASGVADLHTLSILSQKAPLKTH